VNYEKFLAEIYFLPVVEKISPNLVIDRVVFYKERALKLGFLNIISFFPCYPNWLKFILKETIKSNSGESINMNIKNKKNIKIDFLKTFIFKF